MRPEFVTAVKYMVSQRLPVFLFGGVNGARSDAQLVNSVYLDNSQLELYHGRVSCYLSFFLGCMVGWFAFRSFRGPFRGLVAISTA